MTNLPEAMVTFARGSLNLIPIVTNWD